MNNVRRNLLIGFNASLVILIVSSIASYVSISNLLESSKWVNHTHEVIQTLEGFRSSVTDAESLQRGFLLTGDQEQFRAFSDARTRTMESLAKVRTLTSDNPEQISHIPQLNDIVIERFTYLDKNVRRKEAGEPILAQDLQAGYDIMERLRTVVNEMEQTEVKLLDTRTADLNKFSAFTPVLIVIAAALAVLITISFYLRIRKDFDERVRLQAELLEKDKEITNRITIIKGIADKIAQGSYDIRIDDKQSDALGSVAGSLNRMAESLQFSFQELSDREWLQNGLSKLNDVMLGEKDTDTLCRDIVEMLANYTHSHVGVTYLSQGNELQPTAGFACLPRNRPSIRVGDGALGQAVASRKPIVLERIPESNVSISFATGEARPAAVIAFPVFDGYAVVGGIELGSLSNYSKLEVQFLAACAPTIGIGINISLNRRRLQHLLDETQAQAEELRVQHTEMENLNSELEIQAEKLQASEEELKVQQEELKQANQELEERSRLLEERNLTITERNIDIQRQADELAQSTRYKSEFLANMSHELRTPLNSILLLSRLLTENLENNLNNEQIEYARVIQSSGNGLLSLIDEILDLSKIEAGKMELEYQTIALSEIVSDLQGLFGPMARDKHIDLRSETDEALPPTIETDKLRLEQILRNLLSNAIKFTERGSVSLLLRPGHTRELIQFVVRDTGIGIPTDKQQLIFDAFQQADGSTRRRFGGTGLGLSISRELAKLLGGEITLQSEPEKGSEFTVMIPLRKSFRAAPVPAVDSVPVVPRTAPAPVSALDLTDKFISPTIPAGIPDDREAVGPDDKTILIVEDDINFARALLDYTRKKGYKAIATVRGDEAIDLAAAFLPAGILLDIQLPIKSGWQVMEELKANPLTRHIPVHIMSSFEMKNEGRARGAIDFINKPVTSEQMREIFQRIEYVLTQHPKKVLIVEENTQHAKALAYYLEGFEVNTDVTSGVDQVIESFRERNVDCVILDMGVPDQSAYDTLEMVKKTPGLEGLPVIIFTGKSLSHAEEMRIKQYADSIVIKTAHSYKRILDEVSLFLHLMEKDRMAPAAAPKYARLGVLNEVLKNKTVLIADDDMRNIFSLTKALEKYEMNVIAAVDGKDALKKLKEAPRVDIVLMDMMMPEMDGYESTRTIRSMAQFKRLPIIAVTAKAMMGDREKCIDAGASDYITKPIDADQLFSLLRVWLYEGSQ
jgi:signal transduction histidine kinase/DNA-binding response OmpR family regulator/CHASE3 domain sensor protein/HAMP domain-containing protein